VKAARRRLDLLWRTWITHTAGFNRVRRVPQLNLLTRQVQVLHVALLRPTARSVDEPAICWASLRGIRSGLTWEGNAHGSASDSGGRLADRV
jgi:hypothetical protein